MRDKSTAIRRDDIVHNLIRRLSGAEEPKKLLDEILEAAVSLSEATSGSIILIDKATEELSIEAAKGFADRIVKATRLKIGKGITGWVAENGKTLRVDDVRADKRYVSLKDNIRSELAAPLKLERDVIGVINIDSTKVGAFSDDDVSAIETLAALSSRVIADALIHDRLKRRSRQLESLVGIASQLASVVSTEQILEQVTRAAAELTGATLVAVRLLDERGATLTLAAKHGGSSSYENLPPIPVEGSALGGVARSRIPLIIENIQKDQCYKFKDVAKKEKVASMLAVPLFTSERSLGVLAVYRAKPGDFEEDVVTIAIGLAGLAAAALENARLFKRVLDGEKRARQMEMKNAAREMGAELAHQIRNPLTVVRLLVGASGGAGSMTESDREVVIRELKRVDELISALLKNAAGEQAKFDLFDLDALIEEIIAVAKVKASAKEVALAWKGRAGEVSGDRNELWQAIANVVDNAVQAAKSRVIVAAREKNRALELTVEDDGPGVMEGLSVYEPLVTTKSDGVGIGLFSARRIVLEHGGAIEHSRSRALGGASFRITLPLERKPQ